MELTELIERLIDLEEQGKGKYKTKGHNISINTAGGGSYYIDENIDLSNYMIVIDDETKTITFGTYEEYYSY